MPDLPSLAMLIGSTAPVGDVRLDPSTESSDYAAMKTYWAMVDTILAGATAMKTAGELYLPRFQEEKKNAKDSKGVSYDPYELRKQRSPFTNIYDDILKNLASKPFAKEMRLTDPVEPRYDALGEDIDLQGSSFHVFGERVFKAALNHAISWVLVDYSRAAARADGQPLSRAEEGAQGLRPYWVHVPAPRMLAAYSDIENGVEIITHARIYEPLLTLDAFQEVLVERVRVLDREVVGVDPAGKPNAWGAARFVLWEKLTGTKENPRGLWQVIDAGYFSIGYIPLVPVFLTERVPGSYKVEPALQNIAHMQIDEWNAESTFTGICDATCFPMYAAIGVDAESTENLVVGPRSIITVPATSSGAQGDFKSIEPTGSSVQIVAARLEKMRTEMRDLGLQPLTQSNLTVITTGQVAVKANSQVQAWAIRFEDAMEQCWRITANWLGQPDGPEVEVFQDYSPQMDQGQGFQGVLAMRAAKDISREAVIAAAQRYNYLPSDFDIEADAEYLAEEQQGLEGEQPIDPRTGQPLQPTGNVLDMQRRRAGGQQQ